MKRTINLSTCVSLITLTALTLQSDCYAYNKRKRYTANPFRESTTPLPEHKTYNQAIRIRTYEPVKQLQGRSFNLQKNGLRAITDEIRTINK